jgi:integrase/recombinase XerD
MKSLATHLAAYLELRHQLGFKLQGTGSLLHRFVDFAQEQGAAVITSKLALQWATQPSDCQRPRWAVRLGMVRRFAQYVSATDPRTEIPAAQLLPHRYGRRTPYLYSEREMERLLHALRQLPVPSSLRALSQATLVGLLAATGLRLGEAIGLNRQDVNLEQGLLTVREAKFHNARLVPLHRTTRARLREYARGRDHQCPHPQSSAFFLAEPGQRLAPSTVRHWFVTAACQIGLRTPSQRHGPRLHDLRHRFACTTLLNWYRRGLDVEAHLPELSTYLGHRHVADTYWYLSATPELLLLVTQRLESGQARRPA